MKLGIALAVGVLFGFAAGVHTNNNLRFKNSRTEQQVEFDMLRNLTAAWL